MSDPETQSPTLWHQPFPNTGEPERLLTQQITKLSLCSIILRTRWHWKLYRGSWRLSFYRRNRKEKVEVRRHNIAGSLQMLPKQTVVETPTPTKIRREALPSARKRDAPKAKGKSLTATEDVLLRLRKKKLQLENIKLRLEIKRLRKDLEN